MKRRVCRGALLFSIFILLGARTSSASPTPIVVDGPPVGPELLKPGNGLCVASAISSNPATDFGTLTTATFNAGMNTFLDNNLGTATVAAMPTLVDLSNNDATPPTSGYGDFTDAVPGCGTGGCDFAWNDNSTGFGSRVRGYINITSALSAKPLHFGIYADDAVSLTIFDGNGDSYEVMVLPPQGGEPTWRTTNTVTFSRPGVYPIEILYAQLTDHAALELSLLDGSFTDFELPISNPSSENLKDSGFQLMSSESFFQTNDGSAGTSACAQCVRGATGDGGCGSGKFCNSAGLCQAIGTCPATPRNDCDQSGHALIKLSNPADLALRRGTFVWSQGSISYAELATPISGTDYSMCVYDSNGPVFFATAPGAATCLGMGFCWRLKASGGIEFGVTYKDKSRPPIHDGIKLIKAKSDRGTPGKAKFKINLTGANLPAMGIYAPLVAPVTAQLITSDGPKCWEAVFQAENVKKSDASSYSASFKQLLP